MRAGQGGRRERLGGRLAHLQSRQGKERKKEKMPLASNPQQGKRGQAFHPRLSFRRGGGWRIRGEQEKPGQSPGRFAAESSPEEQLGAGEALVQSGEEETASQQAEEGYFRCGA